MRAKALILALLFSISSTFVSHSAEVSSQQTILKNCVDLKTGKARLVKSSVKKCKKNERLVNLALPTTVVDRPNLILSGQVPPTNNVDGKDGDFYIDLTGIRLYGPRANGVWGAGVCLKGEACKDGNTIISGFYKPLDMEGKKGDFFLDLNDFTFYGPKQSDSKWPDRGVPLIGPTGPKGDTGATGPQGVVGPAGAQGPAGSVGPQGIAGPQGVAGPQGAAGATGAQGAQGAQGVQGAKGDAGTSVTIKGSYASLAALQAAKPIGEIGDSYLVAGELYVWNGSSWEDVGLIQGPKGDTGATGAQGPTGSQGPVGPQGPAGANGVTTLGYSGSFIDTTIHNIGTTGSPIPISTTLWSSGVSIRNSSEIVIANAGKYNIAFSSQIVNSGKKVMTVVIWLQESIGASFSDVPFSATDIYLGTSEDAERDVAAWNFFVDASAGKSYRLMIAGSMTGAEIFTGASNVPGVSAQIPGTILTVNQVG